MQYYPNQIKAGNKIINLYENNNNYVLLIAQMQSGKTGTACYVADTLIQSNKINKNNIYYICGLNDNDLKNQMIHDFNNIINKKNILFSKQLQKINNNIKIYTENNNTIIKPELIIIDESHYAGLEQSQVDQFLQNFSNENMFKLSISATPMSEIASENNINIIKKVILKPGKNYYGIQNIFANNKIFQSANFNSDYSEIIDIIDKEYCTNKYAIIRLQNRYYFDDLEEEINQYGWDICFINYHNDFMDDGKDFNEYIKNKPDKMCIIWIYNSLRAGKQLNTEHIGFIHDTYSTNTDTTAQSLLGRICGYNKESHGVNCYVDLKSAERMLVWIKYNYDKGFIPIKSKNILNGNTCGELNWKLHVPIHIELLDEYKEMFYYLKKKYKNKYVYKSKLINSILNSVIDDDYLYDKINNIFSNYKFGKFGGLMVLSEANANRSFKEHWINNYNSYCIKKPIRGFEVGLEQINEDDKKFYYIFCNMNKYSDTFGSCLIIYKKYIPDKGEILYKSDIKISDKSRFNHK